MAQKVCRWGVDRFFLQTWLDVFLCFNGAKLARFENFRDKSVFQRLRKMIVPTFASRNEKTNPTYFNSAMPESGLLNQFPAFF